MANVIADDIDFSAYLEATEPKQKVKPASVYIGELIAGLRTVGQQKHAMLPWDKTHKLIHFRPGEVSLWGGVNGQGKSLMTGLVALSLCTQGERVCIASFEMKPAKTLQRMLRQWSGQAAPEEHELADPHVYSGFKDLYEQFGGWTDKHLWLYDQQGTVKPRLLLAVIRYCAMELGITQFFIDSLMKCISGQDDYNAEKNFVDDLTAIARDLGIHIHLVHHIRKLSGEDVMPDKMDVKGSGAITDQIDNLFLLWRNKKKEKDSQAGKKVADTEPDVVLVCDKQRNGEWEGRIALWYDKASQQFVGSLNAKPLDFYGGFPHR